MISTIGSYVMAVGHARVRRQRRQDDAHRPRAPGNDPWLADTLEWYATSPPPAWNFDTHPYDHERTAAARPAAPARGDERLLDGALGAAARALAAVAGPALAVVSGAAGWGTAHRLLAALALPPLAALVVTAWVVRAAAPAGRARRRSSSSGSPRC